MTILPQGYTEKCLPWGAGDSQDDKTIGELVEEGCAPEHVRMKNLFAARKAAKQERTP